MTGVLTSILLIANALPFEPSFTMTFGSAKERAPSLKVTASGMRARSVTSKDGTVEYSWKGHDACGEGFTVTGTFSRKADDTWAYAFRYEGCETDLDVEEISFPEITVPRTDGTRVLGPKQTGELRLPDWKNAKPGETVSGCGPFFIGFRFMAALDESADCWYIDQRGDARLRPTRYVFSNGTKPHTLRLSAGCIAPVEPRFRRAGTLPFGGEIRRFRGGWYQAAAFYRDWVKTQDWFIRAKSRNFGKLRDMALWMWNRGRSSEVAPQVEMFMEKTGLPVALDWYWWHEIPYDTSYPYFWPPREPIADFRAMIARLKSKGAYVQTYTNGMLWDCNAPGYEKDGLKEALIRRDGSVKTTVFNIFTKANNGWMCGQAPVFQSKIRKLARELSASGLDGLYIDMIANCAYCDCWSETHGHQRGGGRAVADGYRGLFQAVKAENPDMQLSSEEAGEGFIDLVDSMIILYACYERLGCGTAPTVDMPPVFQAVYHGSVALFGSYSVIDGITPWDEKWGVRPPIDEAKWAGKFKDQFACEFARGVVYGLQPCVHKVLPVHLTDPKWATDWKFVEDTAKFYHDNREYLFDGEMRDPGVIRCDTAPVDFFIRGSYTPEEKFKTCRQEALPAVFHSVWKAPDGRIAAVVVNRTRETRRFSLETPDIRAEGVLPPLSWKKIQAVGVSFHD
ncbi:MAG: hypothetical protein E7046_11060 [Lentisphaerae bacterium]|nr:hypothetical protein [Lentisphaerota bacterium]